MKENQKLPTVINDNALATLVCEAAFAQEHASNPSSNMRNV
jgi:hypothetical protein